MKKMTEKSKYYYQKRIKELEDRVSKLRPYRYIAQEIFDHACVVAKTGNRMDTTWVLLQFKSVFE